MRTTKPPVANADRARARRALGSLGLLMLGLLMLGACGGESMERSREVVDDKIEVARDRLADAGAELERTGREGLRQANEGLDRLVAEGREELGSDYQPIAGAAEAIRCESETRCSIDAKFIDQIGRQPAVLAGEAVVVPSQGKSDKGLSLSGVRSGSIPARLGLRDGDLLISLNGTNLASLAAPAALADTLSNTNDATLIYERAGQGRTLAITRISTP